MAAVKKYESLPDLDLGTEIYEAGNGVPELTESSTLRSESDAEDAQDTNLDRRVLDREAARRRFEPAVVDARGANFGDTVVRGVRGDYKTRHRRRRHRRRRDGEMEEGEAEYSDISDEEESLRARLARLKREAEEVKSELARVEGGGGGGDVEIEFKDSLEEQSQEQKEHAELQGDVRDLSKVLDVLSAQTRPQTETLEQEFTRNLNTPQTTSKPSQQTQRSDDPSVPHLQAIAAFSDRLTNLESLLGISPLQPTLTSPHSHSILPTLTTLTSQIQTLHATLAPHPNPLTSTATTSPTPSTTHLEPLSTRLQTLLTESHRLESSRRTAQKAFEDLLESRDRHTHLFQSTTTTSSTSPTQTHSKPTPQTSNEKTNTAQHQISNLFLDTQSARIQSLHALLPQIQGLQPLLPTVLERLRALSVVHEGAAEARGEIDEVEARLGVMEGEQRKWREAVEGLEREVEVSRGVMGENVKTLGGLVQGLEERVEGLRKG